MTTQKTCGTVRKLPRTKKTIKSITLNLALLFAALIVSFFIAEIIISHFFPQDLQKYNLDSDIVYSPRPNTVTKLSGPEFDVIRATNSKGLVDYEYDYDFNGFTIITLGDSFTEASHVKLEEGFPKILESKLRNYTKNVRVVNCGIGNTGTDQQYIFLQKECIKYKPKLAILNFYTGNDFANNYASLIYGYSNGKLVDKRPIKFSLFQRIFHFLNTRFHTIKLTENAFLKNDFTRNFLLRIGLYKNREPYQYNISLQDLYFTNSEIADTGFNKTFLIFDELINYTSSNNIKLIIAIIPTREQVDGRKYEEHFSIYDNTGIKISMTKPNLLLANYLAQKNVTYIDLLPYFKKENKNNTFYFEHDEHFNKKGHELTAEIIYEKLIKSKLIS